MPCSSWPENHSDTDATNEIAAPRKSRALARPSRAAAMRAESNVRFCVVSISTTFVQCLYNLCRGNGGASVMFVPVRGLYKHLTVSGSAPKFRR